MGERCLRCPGRMEIISCSTELPGSAYDQICTGSSEVRARTSIVSLQTLAAFAAVCVSALIIASCEQCCTECKEVTDMKLILWS